jgi:phosphinothricin acetyltransferase
MAATSSYIVRPATETDSPQINDIVNYEVMHSVSNFNYGQRSPEDGLAWFRTTIAGGYPILVATTVVNGQEVVAGYASLGVFRAKDGFRL